MTTWNAPRPPWKRAYAVAEMADGTKYEFECELPQAVTLDMSVPREWKIYDSPLDAIMLPPQMSCFEITFRAQWNKLIRVTKTEPTDVNREDG